MRLAIILALFSFSFLSRCYAEYDWQSGNTYITNTYGDTTDVNGFNTQTGSMWRTQINDQTGNMNGVDAGGNYWNYNAGSGAYYNYGTGVTCYGSGAARTCY